MQVDREYQVQKALFSAGFPVPQPLLHCTDTEVIGTEFYLMEHMKVSLSHQGPNVKSKDPCMLLFCLTYALCSNDKIWLIHSGCLIYVQASKYACFYYIMVSMK